MNINLKNLLFSDMTMYYGMTNSMSVEVIAYHVEKNQPAFEEFLFTMDNIKDIHFLDHPLLHFNTTTLIKNEPNKIAALIELKDAIMLLNYHVYGEYTPPFAIIAQNKESLKNALLQKADFFDKVMAQKDFFCYEKTIAKIEKIELEEKIKLNSSNSISPLKKINKV